MNGIFGLLRRRLLALAATLPFTNSMAGADGVTGTMDNGARRLSFSDSCQKLRGLGQLGPDEHPKIPDHRPRYDDDLIGVEFFRTEVQGLELANLTLPRTYMGRSEIRKSSFRNSDLTESNLCWNDFIDIDFSHASLKECDMRSSNFERVSFRQADLRSADLRRSDFIDCDFFGADLKGAVATHIQTEKLKLAPSQKGVIDVRHDDGPEPDGG